MQLSPMGIGGLVGNWWEEINDSSEWQDGIFYALCAAYALVSSIALVSIPFPLHVSAFVYMRTRMIICVCRLILCI